MAREEAIEQFKYAIDLIKQDGKDYLDKRDIPMLSIAIEALENQKTGHWINRESDFKGQVYHHCSVCNSLSMTGANKYDFFKYCPNCGAKMIEQQENKDIELIIKIPEKQYQSMKNGHIPYSVLHAIMNSTPLPKGHGRLIDADYLREDFKASKRISFAERMDISCIVDHAPTIIEADKEK